MFALCLFTSLLRLALFACFPVLASSDRVVARLSLPPARSLLRTVPFVLSSAPRLSPCHHTHSQVHILVLLSSLTPSTVFVPTAFHKTPTPSLSFP
ncbi:hypothetical protein BDQ17DRAFT_1353362 [Cyathus striatus]|nr:hypothetical protein BDQ17DRAFT_1353362 [Cyathus striatus]